MKIKSLLTFITLLSLFLYSTQAYSCTTFMIKDAGGHPYFGRNFDWPTGLGHIQVNVRNVEKTSFISVPEKPMTWTSKYGSITFNQNGREFPYGGMNEAGLVIEQMMLDDTRYPDLDDRFGLEELQWIQYQLDMSSSVEELIQSDALVRISYTSIALLHFSVADASGKNGHVDQSQPNEIDQSLPG